MLGNALKFTPEGGRIAVSLAHLDSHVVLEVSDTGIGIPPEQLGKIFQRFYQVDGSSKRRFGGVGLGLALVKEIVESHEGTVDVTSAEGEGTTFRIALPACAEEQPHPLSQIDDVTFSRAVSSHGKSPDVHGLPFCLPE